MMNNERRARFETRSALPASYEINYLDIIAGFEGDPLVLRSRHCDVVDFNRYPPAAQFKTLEQDRQTVIAVNREFLAVEPDNERSRKLRH
jgi:hypothetical protein